MKTRTYNEIAEITLTHARTIHDEALRWANNYTVLNGYCKELNGLWQLFILLCAGDENIYYPSSVELLRLITEIRELALKAL